MDFNKIRNIVFLAALSVVTLFFIYIIRPIFYPVFWAAVIASLFYPFYSRLNGFLKVPNLSASIVLTSVILIILIPLTVISGLLVKESIDIYGALGSRGDQINESVARLAGAIQNNAFTRDLKIDQDFWVQKISDISGAVSGFIFETVKNVTQNSVYFLVMFVVMLYALFFFLRDGDKLLKKISYLLPLGNQHELMFYDKFTSTARAAIKGTLVIGLAQGAIGAILFYAVGIPGAMIWGLIMMALSIILGGCYLVWLPAGIVMLVLGNVWQGVVILSVGVLIISTVDNLIRPILIGRDIQMHSLLIFLSTLGGILVFGFTGFIIGPLIVALLKSFWEMYEEYYQKDLASN